MSQGDPLSYLSLSWFRSPVNKTYGHSGLQGWSVHQLYRFARGIDHPNSPIVVRWGQGKKKPSDVIWLTVGCFVISQRCQQVLSGFSGWSTFPVEVFDGYDQLVPGYAGMAVTGRCAQARNNLDRIETHPALAGYQEYVGLLVDPETWDGSDIVWPLRGPGPFVTDRVRAALIKAKLSNIRLERLSDVRMHKVMVDRLLEERNAQPDLQERGSNSDAI